MREARVAVFNAGKVQPVPEVVEYVFNLNLEGTVINTRGICGLASFLGRNLSNLDAIGQMHHQLVLALIYMPLDAILWEMVLSEVGAGIQRHALVQVRIVEARLLALDGDVRRSQLAGVEHKLDQFRLFREYVERRLAFDLARAEADVELELLLNEIEGVARRGVVRSGGDLEGRRHGGRRGPKVRRLRVVIDAVVVRLCDRARRVVRRTATMDGR